MSWKVTPSTPKLTATLTSIGIEVPFTGDLNATATGTVAVRRAGDSAWRNGLPLWRTAASPTSAFYGSLVLLDPGVPYEVRVTIADPDGMLGSGVFTSTVTTRAESTVPTGTPAPTHFVRSTGNDSADGLSQATAWRTIDKAIQSAPASAVVQVGPGYFATSRAKAGWTSTARSQPLTLIAQYPAIDDNRTPVNAGRRSVIEPVGLSSPTGASDGPNPGVWRRVSLVGPTTGTSYSVWTWTGSPIADATQLGYATERANGPTRVAHWKKDSADLSTPAGWAEKLYTNLTYNHGFFATGSDVYLRLPGDRDPNQLYVTMSSYNQAAMSLNGPDIRVSGFEIRQFTNGFDVLAGAKRATIDHNLVSGNLLGVSFRGTTGTPSVYGSDHVVQDNLIQDSSLWSASPTTDGSTIPWMFIKSKIRNADGSDYPTSKIGGQSESAGVSGRGGAQRVVVRRNTIDGTFNGVGNGYNDGYDRYAGQDKDVVDNVIRRIADDALEPEGAAINFRAWNNKIDETLTVLSTGPVNFGPIYLFRNTAWRTGTDRSGGDRQGRVTSSTMLKYSGTSSPPARLFVLHNTFWTDRPSVAGGAQYASVGTAPEALYLRNNLFRATNYAFDAPKAAESWDEDANYFVTNDSARGLRFNGVVYRADVQGYRTASGQGAHTNVSVSFGGDVPLTNPTGGDLSLPASSPLIDAGVPVPNISDRPGVDYQGSAPDIGATRS
jgi:hypothetical protein